MPSLFFADLVRERCHEGGAGALTPAGALPGHRAFADAVPADTSFHYAIAGIAFADEWEVGTGRIDGAGRLAAAAAVPALRHVYGETVSSELRGRAARALAATDPYFAEGPAVECLWDCEEATRELAARHVTTTGDVRVLERLRRLAADPAEEAEVHAAVRVRLTSRERP